MSVLFPQNFNQYPLLLSKTKWFKALNICSVCQYPCKKKSLWCLCFAYFCFILISGTAFSLGVDLQVCTSKTPTCCTKKMEERYQIAAKQDIQQVLQTSSAVLKFLISRNAAAFQGKTFCFLFPNLFILCLIFIFDYLWCNKSYLLIFSFSLCFYAFK